MFNFNLGFQRRRNGITKNGLIYFAGPDSVDSKVQKDKRSIRHPTLDNSHAP